MNGFVVTFLNLLDIVLPPFFFVCICYDFQQMQLMVTLFNILLFLMVVNYLFTVLCKNDIIILTVNEICREYCASRSREAHISLCVFAAVCITLY